MKQSIFFCFVLFIITFTSCKYSSSYKKQAFVNDFSVEYPPYLQKAHGIHPSALLQTKNDYRDIFFIAGMAEKGNDSSAFKTYCDTTVKLLTSVLKEPMIVLDTTFINHQNLLVREIKLTAWLNEKQMFYMIDFYFGKDNYFQTTTGFFNSKRNVWEKDMEIACRSLQEL